MNFRAFVRQAGELSSDMSMDPTMEDAHDPSSTVPHGTGPVHTDGADPAAGGGPSPFNGAGPFSEPVVDDSLWRDPQTLDEQRRTPIPHVEGPDEDKTTLHNARLASYSIMATRNGSR